MSIPPSRLIRVAVSYLQLLQDLYTAGFVVEGRGNGDVEILYDTEKQRPIFRDFSFVRPANPQTNIPDTVLNEYYKLRSRDLRGGFDQNKDYLREQLSVFAKQELKSFAFTRVHEAVSNILGIEWRESKGTNILSDAVKKEVENLIGEYKRNIWGGDRTSLVERLKQGLSNLANTLQPQDEAMEVIRIVREQLAQNQITREDVAQVINWLDTSPLDDKTKLEAIRRLLEEAKVEA